MFPFSGLTASKHYMDINEYSNHPGHEAFVRSFWMKDVTDFLEIDCEPIFF